MESPLSRALEHQEALKRIAEGPVAQSLVRQEELQRAMEGPLAQLLANQEALKRAMESPLSRALEHQEALKRIAEGPVNSFLANRAKFDTFMESLAAVEPLTDADADPTLAAWLAIARRLPSVARLRLATQLVGIAISVAGFAEAMVGAEVDLTAERVQAAVGLLVAMAGYLISNDSDVL